MNDLLEIVEFCKEHKILKYKTKDIELEFDESLFIEEVNQEEYNKDVQKRMSLKRAKKQSPFKNCIR